MKLLNTLNDRINQLIEQAQDKLDQLQPRERLAVIVLAIFLLITTIICIVWFTHKAALNQQKRLVELKETIHWMQTNAARLSPQQDGQTSSAADKVRRVAQQRGLSIQSQLNQEQLHISTSHQNYAVLANFLTEIAKQGVTIISMEMRKQDGGEILLSGIVQ